MWTMDGRTVLVTGATSGLGQATATALRAAGATVLAHARDRRRAEALGDRFVPVWGDLGALAGVRELAGQVHAAAPSGLHVLVNNAGAAFADRQLSPDGVERTLAVNHVAVAALTAALLDLLRAGASAAGRPSRVVNVSSSLERRGDPDRRDWTYADTYRQFQAYADAKLVNLAYTYALAARLDGSPVTVNAANPGSVATAFGRNAGGVFRIVQSVGRAFLASPDKGARTAIRLASDPDLDGANGGYYTSAQLDTSSQRSRDPGYGRWVYDHTAALLA